ncbi:unnamed protein product [Porites lobata]|uniref:G-protein coupled receptors family 1 profile domain-containing protein n=1 Tax=Porites lobata TaxID=104759 RepID=A0ABN8NK11_9CNID|nr:unnamed protein product [Porites lobata]
MKDAASCRVAKERYFLEYILATLPVIALNLGSCPIIILMNALVIVAIKARRRLHSIYNILLACLAGADMAVGLVSQPLFIAQEIFFLSGASVEDYCHFYRKTVFLCLFPSIESLLILALLSMERYIAMKFSLRYASLMTTPRLTGAVLCSWIISVFSVILSLIPATPILIIASCHTTVYLVSRRHINRIKTEQLPSEAKTKFLQERKALKTTTLLLLTTLLKMSRKQLEIKTTNKSRFEQNSSERPFTTMNVSSDSALNESIICRRRDEEYILVNTVTSLFSIALNLGSCPFIILMNVLVIVAIKTRRRLQSEYNILLACLAVTDLAVGVVSQPLFIAQEIYFLSGPSQVDYCFFYKKIVFIYLVPCIESLLILAILSTDRYVAMKFSLRYASIVTTPRLIGAVVCSWLISAISLISYNISWLTPLTRSTLSGLLVYVTVIPAILVIVFCHTTVYFVSRRHMNQIKTQHLSSETKAKFREERKAFKTTSVILAFLFLSYVPGILDGLLRLIDILPRNYPESQLQLLPIAFSFVFWNSLFNPVIYCGRNRDLRKVMLELIKIRPNGN